MSDFSSFQSLFAKKAAQQNVSETLQRAHVCFLLDEMLHKIIPKRSKNSFAKATDLKNRTVTVTVSSSTMAQEVMLHKLELLEGLRQKGYQLESLRTRLQ